MWKAWKNESSAPVKSNFVWPGVGTFPVVLGRFRIVLPWLLTSQRRDTVRSRHRPNVHRQNWHLRREGEKLLHQFAVCDRFCWTDRLYFFGSGKLDHVSMLFGHTTKIWLSLPWRPRMFFHYHHWFLSVDGTGRFAGYSPRATRSADLRNIRKLKEETLWRKEK